MKERAIPIAVLLICVYWFIAGMFRYGLWVDDGPGGGFMLVFSSVVAAIFAVFLLKNPEAPKFLVRLSSFRPVFMIAGTVALSYLIGLMPALALMAFIWLRLLEKYSLATTLMITGGLMLAVWGCFSYWLGVPFPTGFLGQMFVG